MFVALQILLVTTRDEGSRLTSIHRIELTSTSQPSKGCRASHNYKSTLMKLGDPDDNTKPLTRLAHEHIHEHVVDVPET